jgi:DNA-binding PadR family transcriptional regulator
MSLEHAILGFINYGPKTGYDLKKVFDLSVRHFWPADQSQIYRTLARLAERGWAEVETVPQEGRPARKVYHITKDGREALRHWLTTSLPHEEVRSASLIQIFFAGQLSDEEILTMFRREAIRVRKVLEHYDQVPQETQAIMDEVGVPRETFFWMLTLECGIRGAKAHLAWVESVIQRLENQDHPPA